MREIKILALFLIVLFTLSGCVKNNSSSDSSNNTTHSIGDGKEDFWINYPSWHPKSGQSIEHPQWIIDALKEKPLIILAHSMNCYPCIIQQQNIQNVLEEFGDDIEYIDIITDGSDERAWDIYNTYYPQGGQWYIPLTVIISKTEYKGEEKIVWHSVVGMKDENWLRGYIEDAISYYEG